MIILTKCDLLSAEEVAQSIAAVDEDILSKYPQLATPVHIPNLKVTDTAFGSCKKIIPVSSSTGAGVQRLWTELLACVRSTTSNPGEGERDSTAVREHKHADLVRRADLLRQLHQIKKNKLIKEKNDERKKKESETAVAKAKAKSNTSS